MPGRLLERLAEGVVLGDGGYLLELEKRGYVQAGPFTPEVSLTHPEALLQLHREFLQAGADVMQTLTFYATDDKLSTVGLQGKVEEINRAATRIARQAASEGDALVAGNLSLTWAYDPADPASADHVGALFDRQLDVMTEVGIDFVLGETYEWLGEALIAAERAKATGLPVMITMSFERGLRSFDGHSPVECARRLADAGVDVVGVNCLRSPKHTLPLMREIREAVPGYVGCQPVAYRTPDIETTFTADPGFPLGLDPLQLTRSEMAEYAAQARDMGVNYIGSCCGSVAAHVRAMAEALGKARPPQRGWRVNYDKPMSGFELHRHPEEELAGASQG
jgi:betaine-homocysteine S-methyltransferase